MPAKTNKTKEPYILTDTITKQMERLYLSGVQKYADIAAELGIPYKSVNRYMTKWKKRNGLLKAHRKLVEASTPTPADTSELNFLRKFYIDHIGLML